MNIDDFWTVIDTARIDAASASADQGQAFASALVDRLAATSKRTILEYQQRFDQLHGGDLPLGHVGSRLSDRRRMLR
ncbi:DUF4240 domain-containing protein [Streptomyces sp. NPDC048111]|uniref:DUF4240 domain-containing protein n=1 Tax=Streptomyces sp. NPDC048111 TaxID=3365500 RepID=UPI00371E2186